jgi:uncharacterized protein (DUF302 family)
VQGGVLLLQLHAWRPIAYSLTEPYPGLGKPDCSARHPNEREASNPQPIGTRVHQSFVKVLAGGLLMAAQVEAPSAEGVSSKLSPFSVPETVRRLEDTVRAKGLTIFARIDHAGGAREVSLEMRDEQLIVFGNPRAGTPLMVARPLVGLELPLRVLVWRDAEGRVWVSYNESAFVARRFALPEGMEKNIAGVPALVDAALR